MHRPAVVGGQPRVRGHAFVLPLFDLFVRHQENAGVQEDAGRVGPETFEESSRALSPVRLGQHVHDTRVVADDQARFRDLQVHGA